MVKAKIICTLGPASDTERVLNRMIRAGMDTARLNFSHGTISDHLAVIKLIRKLNKRYRRHVKILGDLEGYRIRIGALFGASPIAVKKAQVIRLTTRKISGKGSLIPFDYAGALDRIRKGSHIYIDDGNIALIVEGREKESLVAKVLVPGFIKERKGINMPDVRIDFKGLTEKDAFHIRFCMENEIDLIAQSFVRSADDILALRREMACYSHKCGVIAKIENREGIRNINSIMGVCDGIMVARGDMGISIPVYEVPVVQKEIIKKCNNAKKFVITATQMLESMTENCMPTRAEVSDVANAILDGSDYVMLSAESAVGLYPVECVVMMSKIINFTSSHLKRHTIRSKGKFSKNER